MPVGNLPGWRHLRDDFTKNAPVGSWANACDSGKVVYTGAQGQQWRTYPQCWVDTRLRNPYRPDQVLSVRNGVLNFHLHSVDGRPRAPTRRPSSERLAVPDLRPLQRAHEGRQSVSVRLRRGVAAVATVRQLAVGRRDRLPRAR